MAKTTPEVPATPEMIQAAFAILHQQGWRPAHRSAFTRAEPQPNANPKAKPPTRAQIAAAQAFAEQMGWTPLSPWFADLVRIVLSTNYHGRNVILSVAKAMRREHPWIDDDPNNTNTQE